MKSGPQLAQPEPHRTAARPGGEPSLSQGVEATLAPGAGQPCPMHPDVTSLTIRRARRDARARVVAQRPHPSLRWTLVHGYLSHRRGEDGDTLCGIGGVMVLADPVVPCCPECFPDGPPGGDE